MGIKGGCSQFLRSRALRLDYLSLFSRLLRFISSHISLALVTVFTLLAVINIHTLQAANVYVSLRTSFANPIGIVDSVTDNLVEVLSLPISELALSPDGRYLYGADSQSDIHIYDTRTRDLVDTIHLSVPYPGTYLDAVVGMYITPDGTKLWVGLGFVQSTARMILVDIPNRTFSPLTVGLPGLLSFTRDGTKALATYIIPSGTVGQILVELRIISTFDYQVLATIPICSSARKIVIAPAADRAYVVCNSGNIYVIDTIAHTLLENIVIRQSSPVDAAILPNGRKLYVSNLLGSIQEVDTATNTVSPIFFGTLGGYRPYHMAAISDNKLYVENTSSTSVLTVVDLGTNPIVDARVIKTIPLQDGTVVDNILVQQTGIICDDGNPCVQSRVDPVSGECLMDDGHSFQPEFWNDAGRGKVQSSNNCYAYALNKYKSSGDQGSWPHPGFGDPSLTDMESCEDMTSRAIDDGLQPIACSASCGDGRKIALVVDPGDPTSDFVTGLGRVLN